MKCPHCGSPLGLEDEFCSFCGQPNKLARKHQADMRRYRQEFTRTQQNVYLKTRRFASLTIPIIIICVLILLNVGAVVFVQSSWSIGSDLEKKEIRRHLSEHRENLEFYLTSGDYCGFASYYNSNSLYLMDDFEEYDVIIYAAEGYFSIFRILLNTSIYGNFYLDEENIPTTARSMSQNLDNIFNAEEYYSYREEKLTETNQKYLYDIQEQAKALLITYCGLSPEEVDALPDMSSAKQQEVLERRLGAL